MAKFILGGIVTNIAGSVGGTTLRRVKNGFSMYNKIKGASVSKLLQNQRVPQIANIFQRWALLDDALRSGWNATALTVTFPDKFGVAKNLTGRQLFTKANIQGLPAAIAVEDSATFTTEVTEFSLDSITNELTVEEIIANITVPVGEVGLMFSVEISNKQIYQPTFKSRKVIAYLPSTGTGALNLYEAITTEYPFVGNQMWIAIYVQGINEFGMVSAYQYGIMKLVLS